MRLYYNGEITYKPMLVWMVAWQVNEHYWTRWDLRDPEVSPLYRTPSNPGPQNHGWVELNISIKESQSVLCQQEEGQRSPELPEAGIHSGLGQPSHLLWTQWREPRTQRTLHTTGPLAHPKPRHHGTQDVDWNSRLLDTCPVRGEIACRDCSDHYDSGECWTHKKAVRG